MIQRMRTRLSAESGDAGLGMTEVLAAMMIFAVIAVGMAYSLITMSRLNLDTRSREVASALAAQEIDTVRAVPDAFNVQDRSVTQVVNGTSYTIKRSTGWVSTNGSTANCGAGSGGSNLQYKGVQVTVTWPNMMILKKAVQANTDLAPQTRVNDPSFGTIAVSVLGADGTGRAGVGVTVTQVTQGAPVGSVAATDSDGCAYVLKVTAGTYKVAINASNYVDVNQITTPSQTVTVAAGSSSPAPFQYDRQATYNATYASNYSGNPRPKLPDTMVTNYLSKQGNVPFSNAAPSVRLYPWGDGYAAIAGAYTATGSTTSTCLSVDPANWAPGTVNGVPLAQGLRQVVGIAPGGSAGINVPMGVVKVTWPLGATSLTAKTATAPAATGDPGCAQAQTYTYSYPAASIPAAGSTVYLALPFGSWTVSSTIAGILTGLPAGGQAVLTQGELTGTIVTLDARLPQ